MSVIKFDNDIAGNFPIHQEVVKIGANQNLKRGAILAAQSGANGAKAKVSFALSALTAANDKTVTLNIGEESFVANVVLGDTVDTVLDKIAAAAADASGFNVSADKEDDKVIVEAKLVGAAANEVTITMAHTATVTIGDKVTVTSGSDPVDNGLVLVEGDAQPVARLMEDVVTGDVGGRATVARTGCFATGSIIVGATANDKLVKDKLAARCIFFKSIDGVNA